jgi:hypothetical protein
MNEPFVGGDAARYQDSHEQVNFKKLNSYNIDPNQGCKIVPKDLNEAKTDMIEELAKEFTGYVPDINTLVIK